MSLTNSADVSEGEGNKLAKGSGQENENEQKGRHRNYTEGNIFIHASWFMGNRGDSE